MNWRTFLEMGRLQPWRIGKTVSWTLSVRRELGLTKMLFCLGITLHAKIEDAKDARVIAIIPSLPVEKAQTPTQWRCVLTKESYRDRIFSRDLVGHASRWNVGAFSRLPPRTIGHTGPFCR